MLHVVIATLDNVAHTKELIRCLQLVRGMPGLRVIVVDNGSTDETLSWLPSFSAITVLGFQQNQGVASAWNGGIRFAVTDGASTILVAGNDTAPLPGTVEKLYRHIQDGALFVSGTQVPYETPATTQWDDDPSLPFLLAPDYSFFMFSTAIVGGIASRDIEVEVRSKLEWEKQNPGKPYPMMMLPWDYGVFDSGFQLAYFEDNDHHMRAAQAGIPCLRDQTAAFRHDCSLTIRSHPELAAANQQTFPANAERFRQKWGALPHEIGISSARPLNVTDEQWARMTGGRQVQEIPRSRAIEEARRLYAANGVRV